MVKMELEIRYAIVNGIAFISLVGFRQHIVNHVRSFQRITGVSSRAVAGECPVTREQAVEMGFLVPAEAAVAV